MIGLRERAGFQDPGVCVGEELDMLSRSGDAVLFFGLVTGRKVDIQVPQDWPCPTFAYGGQLESGFLAEVVGQIPEYLGGPNNSRRGAQRGGSLLTKKPYVLQ